MNWILFWAGWILDRLLELALLAAVYVFCALPLYRIACARRMRMPWFAWVPVLGLLQLFAITDSTRRDRGLRGGLLPRVVLLGLAAGLLWLADNILLQVYPAPPRLYEAVSAPGTGFWLLLSVLVALVLAVSVYQGLYRLYCICKPHSAVTFTVLSVLSPVAIPIFLFLCRDEYPRSGW